MLVKVKSAFCSVCCWLNRNATKRYLLTLDRLCTMYLFSLVFSCLVYVNPDRYGNQEALLYFVGAMMLYLTAYTPAYMFSGSNDELGQKKNKSN